ncbi:uncharacterized protein LOC117231367 isoform X2 [Bombus vosnesenskii]|uniref:Uncharacterized protein LOC117231367 isoform X2 n=3 Tax=Pyrobombus TaxID=144703 RepID=A0A6J3JXU7_9HYME|nr:uncharacterized protein LOC100750186 isoform X2 [Bombus impatiens]XP_033201539.1 uncharacterized protein LOC117163404 isoform X2 [Bombus vancouverensis nearcticus]XP_033298474.1 uncharacterized protein LOC117204820 isoform X2 [Bombus bifarius]XP_033345658.1 uncharacterized protein LOC117231367 isoform X2 [Bombus vosnesenskii]XP_050474807.1 uncharacterized protein LOC126865899 isoform X1 [Bombus huntii]
MTRHLWLKAAFAFFVISGASCLRDVSLEVVPEVVQRGQKVILRCHYDLEEAPLYSLKWYRGRHEFYRYTPSEEPATKVFNITGIYVDHENSNKSQVTLRDVDFALSGMFSCEVTADAPTFTTAYVSKNLTVVFLPEGTPIIVSERERYDAGDTLRANCSLPPSKPPAHLSFTLNNVAVESYTNHQPQPYPQQRWDRNDASSPHTDQTENLQWIEIRVNLQPFHFSNGQLNLRCSAQIPGIYSAISEVQLGAGLREPVPERESCCFGIDNQLCSGKPELFGIGNQLCSGEPRYLT